MATSSVSTANEISQAITSLGANDTLIIAPGVYSFNASLIGNDGDSPNVIGYGATLDFWKTPTWTDAGNGQHYFTLSGTDPFEIPRCVYINGVAIKQAKMGPFPYDYNNTATNVIRVSSTWDPGSLDAYTELLIMLPHDCMRVLGSRSSNNITCYHIQDTSGGNPVAQSNTLFSWVNNAQHYRPIVPGYYVMNNLGRRPGTWWFDRANNRVYVWLKNSQNIADVRVPQNCLQGVRIRNTPNRHLAGFRIRGVNAEPHSGVAGFSAIDGALITTGCDDSIVEDITFECTAGTGLSAGRLELTPYPNNCDNLTIRNIRGNYVGGNTIVAGGSGIRCNNVEVHYGCQFHFGGVDVVFNGVTDLIYDNINSYNSNGGSIHVSTQSSSSSVGQPIGSNAYAYNCGLFEIMDRGIHYFVHNGEGGLDPAPVPCNPLTSNHVVERTWSNGKGWEAYYIDNQGSGTVNNPRIVNYGGVITNTDLSGQESRAFKLNTPSRKITINYPTVVTNGVTTIDCSSSTQEIEIVQPKFISKTRERIRTSGTVTIKV